MNDKITHGITRHYSLKPGERTKVHKSSSFKSKIVDELRENVDEAIHTTNYDDSKMMKNVIKRKESSSDKRLKDALKNEKDFMEYVLSLPVDNDNHDNCWHKNLPSNRVDKSNANNDLHLSHDSMASSSNQFDEQLPDDANSVGGFEHLDNLCKLMTQLGELRESNSKLQRKVQYLEETKRSQGIENHINFLEASSTVASSSSSSSSPNQLSPSIDYGHKNASINSQNKLSSAKMVNNDNNLLKCPSSSWLGGGGGGGEGGNRFMVKRSSKVHKSRSTVFLDGQNSIDRIRSKSVGHVQIDRETVLNGKSEIDDLREIKTRTPWSRVKNVFGWDKSDHVYNSNRNQLPDNLINHHQLLADQNQGNLREKFLCLF